MTSAQKELSAALRSLSDSHGGLVAQVECANNRIEYSLESRVKTMDALLHEWKSDLLRIWIPMVAGACTLIGLFGGIEIQGCRDTISAAVSTRTGVPIVPTTHYGKTGAHVHDSTKRQVYVSKKQWLGRKADVRDSHRTMRALPPFQTIFVCCHHRASRQRVFRSLT